MPEDQIHNEIKTPIMAGLKALGEEIRQIRRDIPMTQGAMAVFVGLGEKKISAIEAGECTDLSDIIKYCEKISIGIELNFVVY